jgi:hypothetical protein
VSCKFGPSTLVIQKPYKSENALYKLKLPSSADIFCKYKNTTNWKNKLLLTSIVSRMDPDNKK